jgi:hypothetical protein
MKTTKFLSTMCAVLIAFSMSACGETNGNSNNITAETPTIEKKYESNEKLSSVESKEDSDDNSTEDFNRTPNVRDLCWKDSIDTIKEIEGNPVDSGDEGMLYYVELCGYDARLLLKVDKDYGLYYAGYIIDDSGHTQSSTMLLRYENIVDKITEKYGSSEHIENKKNKLMDYCDTKYEAIELGYLMIVDKWATEDTEIIATITEQDYNVLIVLQFQSKNFTEPEPENGF